MDSNLEFDEQINNLNVKIKYALKDLCPSKTYKSLSTLLLLERPGRCDGVLTGLSRKKNKKQPDSWCWSTYSYWESKAHYHSSQINAQATWVSKDWFLKHRNRYLFSEHWILMAKVHLWSASLLQTLRALKTGLRFSGAASLITHCCVEPKKEKKNWSFYLRCTTYGTKCLKRC